MKRVFIAAFVCAFGALTNIRGATAQSYVSIDPPNAEVTFPFGVRNGNVVGLYYDTLGQGHGFLYTREGLYTSFDGPGAYLPFGTYAIGIDDGGSVTGWYYVSPQSVRGFVRKPDGTITVFNAPKAGSEGTYVNAVNRFGVAVGVYYDATFASHGFIRWPSGKFAQVDIPNSNSTVVTAVSDSETIVGYFESHSGPPAVRGFLRKKNGQFVYFDPPVGFHFDMSTIWSINDSGDILANCSDLQSSIFVGCFRAANGVVTVLSNSLGAGSFSGLTRNGQMSGTFLELGRARGFVRSASGDYSSFDFPLFNVRDTSVRTSDAEGNIIGTYNILHGLSHGFIRYAAP